MHDAAVSEKFSFWKFNNFIPRFLNKILLDRGIFFKFFYLEIVHIRNCPWHVMYKVCLRWKLKFFELKVLPFVIFCWKFLRRVGFFLSFLQKNFAYMKFSVTRQVWRLFFKNLIFRLSVTDFSTLLNFWIFFIEICAQLTFLMTSHAWHVLVVKNIHFWTHKT